MLNLTIFCLFSIISVTSLFSWPGDQASLSCIPGPRGANDTTIRTDIEDQYFSRNTYATTDEAQKAINKQAAIDRVKTAVRNNHDRDFTVTKLGDSLSDLVDFYGVATPRKLFPNYGDAAGTFGGNPLYMDSWDDYMTAGAGIANANGIREQTTRKVTTYLPLSPKSLDSYLVLATVSLEEARQYAKHK